MLTSHESRKMRRGREKDHSRHVKIESDALASWMAFELLRWTHTWASMLVFYLVTPYNSETALKGLLPF